MDYQKAIETLQDIHDVAEVRIKSGDTRGVVYIPSEKIKDIESALSAMEELEHYKQLGTLEEVKAAVDKQQKKKPVLSMNEKSGMFVDYADGHGEYKTQMNNWLRCPCCNSVVGQRVIVHNRTHD